jgi:hypothetical protein
MGLWLRRAPLPIRPASLLPGFKRLPDGQVPLMQEQAQVHSSDRLCPVRNVESEAGRNCGSICRVYGVPTLTHLSYGRGPRT